MCKMIKTYNQFVESFSVSRNELPALGDIVDNVEYKEGEKIAFVDFNGVKDIPIHITSEDVEEVENVVENVKK